MHLEKLQLINFKNYGEVTLDFSDKINVFVGTNGSGKTNLLDAIHFLSMTRSAFAPDNYCVRHGEQFFAIKGWFANEGAREELLGSYESGSKKTFREGVNEYRKLSDHIGKYPAVLIAPDDTELVKEGSEQRRKFFDSLLSQLDKNYLEALIQYHYALKQRNSLLKLFADSNSYDAIALDSYDQLMERTGEVIFNRRKTFMQEFSPIFRHYFGHIAGREVVEIAYKSELFEKSFHEGLAAGRQRDLVLQRTGFGVHRDDYSFTIGQGDLKRLGSQGQQKSFVIALKLAQFHVIKMYKRTSPVLLLDDLFDKLDDLRIARLLALFGEGAFGQMFITDARPDRTQSLLRKVNLEALTFVVNDGKVTPA